MVACNLYHATSARSEAAPVILPSTLDHRNNKPGTGGNQSGLGWERPRTGGSKRKQAGTNAVRRGVGGESRTVPEEAESQVDAELARANAQTNARGTVDYIRVDTVKFARDASIYSREENLCG